MATGTQCGVWNRQTTLELTSGNATSLKTWIFVINYCLQLLFKVPSLDDGGFIPWPLGASVVFEIDKQCLNWRRTNETSLKAWIFVINHCLQWLYKVHSLDNGGFIPWPLGPSVVFEIDKQRLNWRRTNETSLNTWIFVINHCLQWLYKVPSLDDGGFIPWPLGPVWCLKSINNAWIDVGQA